MPDPIATIDDIRWSLGAWLLSQETLTPAEVKKHVHAARELATLVELNLKLKEVTDRGFAAHYFSPDARREIREIIDAMDAVSAGTHKIMSRRNDQLPKGDKNAK